MARLKEASIENQLMDIFSEENKINLEERINKSGLCGIEYKQGLKDSLFKGEIRTGKTYQESLAIYDNKIKWDRRLDWLSGKLAKGMFIGSGSLLTFTGDYLILGYFGEKVSWITDYLQRFNLSEKGYIIGLALISIPEYLLIRKGAIATFYKIGEMIQEYEERRSHIREISRDKTVMDNHPSYAEMLKERSNVNIAKENEVATVTK